MDRENCTLKSKNDEVLMGFVRDRDDARSFEILVHRWKTPIHRLCYRMTLSWQDAEDVTQEVFSNLYRSRTRYRPTAKFSTYLWRIALNRCRDFLKSRNLRRQKHDQWLNFESESSQMDLPRSSKNALDVQRALNKLELHFREVVVMRHFENLKYSEIAEILGVPMGTVASRMSTALKQLAQTLSPSHTTDLDKSEVSHESFDR